MASPVVSSPPTHSPSRFAVVEWLETVPVPLVAGYGRDTSLLIWTWFFWGLGLGLWSYLWPIYLASLGASSVEVGLVMSVTFVVATLCYVPGGFVAQLGHHKWQLAGIHILPIVAVASFGLAGTWWHVIPGVMLANLVGLAVPAINSFIAQIADDDGIPVPRVFTVIGASLYAAMTISPPLGGWVGDTFGLAVIFPLASLCYAISVFGMAMLRSRPMPEEDPKGASGRPGQQPDNAAGAGRRRALSAGSGAYLGLLRSGTVRLFLLTTLLTHGAMHLAVSFAPLYLGEVYAYDRAWIGWAGSAASAGTVVLLLTIERFRRRYGAVSATWLACGFMALHFVFILLHPALAVQLIGFFWRGGFQTVATLTTVALTEAVSRARLAPATALLATVAGFAAMVTPPAGGWLYAHRPELPFIAGSLVLIATFPLIARAFRPAPQPSAASIATLPAPATPAATDEIRDDGLYPVEPPVEADHAGSAVSARSASGPESPSCPTDGAGEQMAGRTQGSDGASG